MRAENNPTLRVRLFGRFEVRRDHRLIPQQAWGRRKTQTLLKILLAERGRVLSQDQLVEILFGGIDPEKELHNLHTRISELRRVIEPGLKKGIASQFILRVGEGYCFSKKAPCWLDTEAFLEHLSAARKAREEGRWHLAIESYEAALELYRGEYLEEDRYEEWSLAPRDDWQNRYLNALSHLAECYAQLEDVPRAVECCERVLETDSARERVIRQLMRLHCLGGEHARAIEVYQAGVRALKERLDVVPSPQTQALYQQISKGELPKAIRLLDPLRIAVLPLVNISPDPEDEYFTDGMTEELIYNLSKIRELKVIAQTSALTYKNTSKSVAQIGRELRVGTVLEGSVRKADHTLRITAQLIDVQSETHLWSEEYQRDLEDVFAIQSDIAKNVSVALRDQLLNGQKHIPAEPTAENLEAYTLYLKGRYFWKKRSIQAFKKAIEYFEQALTADPNCALAYAGLGETQFMLAQWEAELDLYLAAEEAAHKALQIDPALAEAHRTLALIDQCYYYNWPRADEGFQKALALNPNLADTHNSYGLSLAYRRRFKEAVLEMKKALELDPLSLVANRNLGTVLWGARRYDEAIEQLKQTIEMDPCFSVTHFILGLCYLDKSMYEDALAAFKREKRMERISSEHCRMSDVMIGVVEERLGSKGALERVLEQAIKARDPGKMYAPFIGFGYLAAGDPDRAFEWLSKTYREAGSWLPMILTSQLFDKHRAHPGYNDLLKKINLDGLLIP